MPVPRNWGIHSVFEFQGQSRASSVIRPIVTPHRMGEAVALPDPRVPGEADRFAHRLGGRFGRLNLATELRGRPVGGALHDLPQEHDLLRAVGFDHTVNTGVSVVYELTDSFAWTTQGGATFPLDACRMYYDGFYTSVEDAVGNATFKFPANDIYTIDWNWFGNWSLARFAELVNPAVTESVGAPHTGYNNTVTIDGADYCYRNLEIALNNDIPDRDCLGAITGFNAYAINDRDVTISGVIEAPAVATGDWFAFASNRTAMTLSLTTGSVAANIFNFAMDFTLNNFVDFVDADGWLGYAFEGKMAPASRLVITLT